MAKKKRYTQKARVTAEKVDIDPRIGLKPDQRAGKTPEAKEERRQKSYFESMLVPEMVEKMYVQLDEANLGMNATYYLPTDYVRVTGGQVHQPPWLGNTFSL